MHICVHVFACVLHRIVQNFDNGKSDKKWRNEQEIYFEGKIWC